MVSAPDPAARAYSSPRPPSWTTGRREEGKGREGGEGKGKEGRERVERRYGRGKEVKKKKDKRRGGRGRGEWEGEGVVHIFSSCRSISAHRLENEDFSTVA